MIDHVHMMISIPPKYAVSQVFGFIKGKSAIHLAPGTRGDRLTRGEPTLKIHGQEWPVRCEIVQLDSMSAHADYSEILDWLRHFRKPPLQVFITHGMPAVSEAMCQRLLNTFGWSAVVPKYGETFDV